MGWLDRWKDGPYRITADPTPVPKSRHTFSAVPVGTNDYAIWNALVSGQHGDSVSRTEAMSVPAVKRARDIFVHSLGTLPIHDYRAGVKQDRQLFEQPESPFGFTRAYTLGMTLDDLFFHAKSLWVKTTRAYDGYPLSVRRIPFGEWTQDGDGVIRIGGRVIPNEDRILFLVPGDGFLKDGAATVRSGITLRLAADKYASRPELTEWFTTNDGSEPTEEEIAAFLAQWQAAREAGTTGFIPGTVDRNEAKRMTAEELQLVGAREFNVLEISRLTGISPVWLSTPVTSRQYTNAESENLDFLKGPAAPFIAAIEQRLSFGDVSPNGHYAKISMDAFLRVDTATRYQTYTAGLAGRWLTLEEVRALEDLPPLPTEPKQSKPIESDNGAGEGHNSIGDDDD